MSKIKATIEVDLEARGWSSDDALFYVEKILRDVDSPGISVKKVDIKEATIEQD